VGEAQRHQALAALVSVDVGESLVTLRLLALLNFLCFFRISLVLLLLFLFAVAAVYMALPNLVGVFVFPGKTNSEVTNGAKDDVDAVPVSSHCALVVVGPGVLGARDHLAKLALKGQVFLLVAQCDLAMLTNFTKLHSFSLSFFF